MTHDKNEVVGLEKRRSIWQKYWEGRMGRTSDSLNRGSDKGWSPQRSWKLEGEWDHAPSKGRLNQTKMLLDPRPRILCWNFVMIQRGSPVVRSSTLEPEGPEVES